MDPRRRYQLIPSFWHRFPTIFGASLVFCSQKEVYFCAFDTQSGVYSVKSLDFEGFFENETVTGCVGVFKNKDNPELGLYGLVEDFELTIFTSTKSGKVVQSLLNQVTGEAKHEVIHVTANAIQHLVFFRNRYLLLGFHPSLVHVFDFQIRKVVSQVDLTDLKGRSEDFVISGMVPGNGSSLWLSTAAGKLVKAKVPEATLSDGLAISQPIKFRTFPTISPLPEKLSCLCLIERQTDALSDKQQDSFVYVASKSGKISGFSAKSHALVDSFTMEGEVTALDCFVSLDQNVVFAIGLKNGRVHIRYDWELYFKSFNCRDKITCLRFSKNGLYLVAGSLQSIVYLFNLSEGTIFEVGPKEIFMGDEIPLSVDFSQDQKCFIIGNSSTPILRSYSRRKKIRTNFREFQNPNSCVKFAVCFWQRIQNSAVCLRFGVWGWSSWVSDKECSPSSPPLLL